MRKLLSIILLFVCVCAWAQIGFWPNDTSGKDNSVYALENITLYTDYETKIEDAVLVFQDGKVLAAGKMKMPEDAVVLDGKGAFIYPSFIDVYAHVSVGKAPKIEGKTNSRYLPKDNTSAAYNDAVHADVRAVETFVPNEKASKEYLHQGFGTVLTFNQDGIVQGTAVLTGLGDGDVAQKIIQEDAALMLSFKKGASQQAYPTSLTGSIALLRQLYLDAKWYENQENEKVKNLTLESFNHFKNLPTIFETQDKFDVLRADRIGDEAGFQFAFLGSGNEYQRAKEIKATNGTVILPLEYPKALDIKDELEEEIAEIRDLKHWELAPYNAVFLAKENVPFAFTLHKLKKKDAFFKKLRELNENGLSQAEILKALTVQPAELLNVSNKVGQLKKGADASFIVFSGDLFEEESLLYENWVQGKQFVVNKMPKNDIRGNYQLTLENKTYDLKIQHKITQPKAEIIQNEKKGKAKLNKNDYKISWEIQLPNDSLNNYRLYYPISDFKNAKGFAIDKSGKEVPFSVQYISAFQPKKKEKKTKSASEIGKIWYPFNAYGFEALPTQKDYIIKNATVWTNAEQGVAEGLDVKISDGKIVKVGQNLSERNAIVIDGTYMHLTSGIIDEHTHIGLSRGVNEAGTNNSAEVRMGDVINPDDINFYRQLAGGVTAAQQLHGSANPVGGQSSIVKFRWGNDAEGMKIKAAPQFIKFALGENVKQSNWGNNPNRYPQSRPGVEQTFDFWFTRAQEYEKEKAKNPNYRKDLRLETMSEIINKERFITCHSYVQSEINMLMHVAEKFGFTVNTFTHILEGYKVADKMKEHGVNASTFSDWWAYKEEVREAIPYNAALLMQVGVNTAINSDDAEMARRLNQEAAKIVKYGDVSQEEAWKTVTLNPAKMLHLDHRMGSIEEGKDADLVLWTDNPLSVYAQVDKTFVDGILYYDTDLQKERDAQIAKEKNRIIQKMLSGDVKKEDKKPVEVKEEVHYHCDTVGETEHASH